MFVFCVSVCYYPDNVSVCKKVVPVDDFVLSIIFDNGEHGKLDMKNYLDFGVFRRLKDPAFFRRVHVSFDTIEWDSGIDLDPEFVYAKCKIIGTLQPVVSDDFQDSASPPLNC